MLKFYSFLKECCFKGCNMGLKVKKNTKYLVLTPRYIGHRGVSTPWYLGHRGVSTPWYLGLFWIFSGSGFATPRYIEHRGVLTQGKVLKSLDSPVHRTSGSLDSPVPRTPGSLNSLVLRTLLDFQRVKFCNSLVHRTPGSFDSPVHSTPGSLDSPVHSTPGSHFKMLINQPRSKKIETALGHLYWDQEEVFSEKTNIKNSRETVPLNVLSHKNYEG